MVGTLASCQPKPVLMTSAPAASMACASAMTSCAGAPPSTRSSADRRYMIMASGPSRWRVRRTISTGRRWRLAMLPPNSSLRLLQRVVVNWLMK